MLQILFNNEFRDFVNEEKLTNRTKRRAAAVAAAGQWLNAHLTSKLPTMC